MLSLKEVKQHWLSVSFKIRITDMKVAQSVVLRTRNYLIKIMVYTEVTRASERFTEVTITTVKSWDV